MVGIQHYHIGSYFHDHYGDLISLPVIHSQLHTYFGLHSGRKTINGEFDDRLRISGAIGIVHRDLDGLLLADGHSHHAIIETFYHHSTTDLEFKRSTTFGRIECRPVAQTAVIMDLYGITCFHFLCHMLYFLIDCFAKPDLQGRIK